MSGESGQRERNDIIVHIEQGGQKGAGNNTGEKLLNIIKPTKDLCRDLLERPFFLMLLLLLLFMCVC
jgi:hypothetical protein